MYFCCMKSTETTISEALIAALESAVGKANLLVADEEKTDYGSDETEDYHFMPGLVVKPGSASEISAVMQLANEYKIPVVQEPVCRVVRCPFLEVSFCRQNG